MIYICGICNQPCEPIERRLSFVDEAYGIPKSFEEITLISECCKGDVEEISDTEYEFRLAEEELADRSGEAA
jgi:hypothetical protein